MSKLYEIIEKPLPGEWGSDDKEGEGIPVLRTTNFTNIGAIDYSNVVTRKIDSEKAKEKFLRKGDIIIEKSGGSPAQPVGRVVFFEGEDYKFLFNNFTSVLRLKDKDINFSKYLFYHLFAKYKLGATRKFQNKTTGISNLKLDEFIKKTEISLPPIETQKQIAKTLDTAAELLALRKQQLAELDKLIKSTFYEMFGDPVTNEKGWEMFVLGNCLDRIESGWSPVCKERAVIDKEWGVCKLSAVTGGYYKENENKAILSDTKINTALKVRNGDLLFSRKNTIELVGSCAYVFESRKKLMIPDTIFRLCTKGNIHKLYLWGLLNCQTFKSFIRKLAAGTSGSMPNISKERLKGLKIPLPIFFKQTQFAEIVTKVEEQKNLIKKAIDETQHLFDSLMSRYFD